jgi:hypothetical protein
MWVKCGLLAKAGEEALKAKDRAALEELRKQANGNTQLELDRMISQLQKGRWDVSRSLLHEAVVLQIQSGLPAVSAGSMPHPALDDRQVPFKLEHKVSPRCARMRKHAIKHWLLAEGYRNVCRPACIPRLGSREYDVLPGDKIHRYISQAYCFIRACKEPIGP